MFSSCLVRRCLCAHIFLLSPSSMNVYYDVFSYFVDLGLWSIYNLVHLRSQLDLRLLDDSCHIVKQRMAISRQTGRKSEAEWQVNEENNREGRIVEEYVVLTYLLNESIFCSRLVMAHVSGVEEVKKGGNLGVGQGQNKEQILPFYLTNIKHW